MKWQLIFPPDAKVKDVRAGGRDLVETDEALKMIYTGTTVRQGGGPSFAVPNNVIGDHRTIVDYAGMTSAPPRLTAFWVRSFVYNAEDVRAHHVATAAVAPDMPDYVASREKIPGLAPYEWWRHHLAVVVIISIAFCLVLGLIMLWSCRQIKGLAGRSSLILVVPLVFLCVLSAITTNFDMQLFKGLGERFWLYGPLPALTLTGYGPAVDVLFSIPMLPYILLTNLMDRQSEFALNFAYRIPFLVGWLFMMATSARLLRLMDLPRRRQRTAWMLVAMSPNVFIWNLWQPEALIVACCVLSVCFLMSARPVLAGLLYGVAVCGKYWPLFIGPLLLTYAARNLGWRAASSWLLSGVAATGGLIAAYWAPTFVAIGSPNHFFDLLRDRSPYFGGSSGASFATVWSLYSLPKQLFSGVPHEIIVQAEKYSFLLVLLVFVLTAVTAAARPLGNDRLVLLVATVLAAAAGLNSLSVAGFAAWSLPFLVAGAVARRRGTVAIAVASVGWVAGALVTFVIEPVTFWLQNTSAGLDHTAQTSARWLYFNLVNPRLAQWFGFVFCAGLALAALITWWLAFDERAEFAPDMADLVDGGRKDVVSMQMTGASSFVASER